MRYIALAVSGMVLVAAPTVAAQTVRIGAHSVAMVHTEVREGFRSEGVGGAVTLGFRWRRFGLEALGMRALMKPDSADLDSFDLWQWDVRVSYWVASVVGIEIGGGRRIVDPEFAAQDVGAVRVGFVSEYPLARIADVWVRGAYLVDPQFNGGGQAGLAVEIALGVGVGTANGRFRVRADAEFQRIDREVDQLEVPIQVTQARLGLELGF